jgi:deazaflavin-dependent oxidoreductase (nitroreductase family)
VIGTFVAVGLFERLAPRRVVRAYQRNIGGPAFRYSAGFLPGWAVVETTGRRTGRARRTPVGGRLGGDTYWLVAGYDRSDFIRNIEANPKVRLRVHGRWREGLAHACHEDDPVKRLWKVNPVNSFFLWIAGTERLLSVRVDLSNYR